jgi:hypothetical protein
VSLIPKSTKPSSHVLAQREHELIKAQKVLSQGQLDALKYEWLPDAGIDPRKVNAFLYKNGDSFAESISSLYGKKVADEHLKNLKRRRRLPTAGGCPKGRPRNNLFRP